MNESSAIFKSAAAVAALAILAIASPADAQLVAVKNAGDALIFAPLQETRQLTLTVVGPCDYQYRTRTEKGELVFPLPDDVMDGAYSYALDATPYVEPRIMEVLTKARKSGDSETIRELCRAGKLPTGPVSQSGGFTVVERKIVLDTTPEEKRGERDGSRAATLSLEPGSDGDVQFATGSPADADPIQLASAEIPSAASAPGDCFWARMKRGAGVAER